jgi:hypothetical protein
VYPYGYRGFESLALRCAESEGFERRTLALNGLAFGDESLALNGLAFGDESLARGVPYGPDAGWRRAVSNASGLTTLIGVPAAYARI